MSADVSDIRELTQDETMAVAGGLLHALAPAAAIILVGTVLILDEVGALDDVMADANPY